MPKEKEAPPISGGTRGSPFDLDSGTRPSDFNAWFANAAPLLDSDIAVTNASTDRYVAVAMHAILVTQWSDAVFSAHALRVCRQRKSSRTRHGDRDGKNVGDTHSVLHCPPASQRAVNDAVPIWRRAAFDGEKGSESRHMTL
jgi:hypothetical protein